MCVLLLETLNLLFVYPGLPCISNLLLVPHTVEREQQDNEANAPGNNRLTKHEKTGHACNDGVKNKAASGATQGDEHTAADDGDEISAA